MTSPIIHRVTTLALAVRPIVWPFAEERRAEIAAHFAEKQRERPKIWNGRVLMGRDPVFADGHFTATYFETDFASFLAWRDWGFPGAPVFNGFGMGALRTSDGAFLMGEMAQHTANAGRIYFPSGTPDLDDVRDGMLDIPGSVVREIQEETGLTAADYRAEPDWYCVVSGPTIAMMQVLNLDMPGDEARARIETNLAREHEPELSAIHLVRGTGDLTPTMPRFVTAFIEQQFASR
ncbi:MULTISPECIES: NUDIX hydrolase [unclassified Bradyrhizobium]|uniref:NUDIX hydrolase n=1 Tax=unclassified Bradyrhizobium TaxID=2631580 RepID=UPI0015CA7755|nr:MULTISPECIES: NUDIX hydrolase [unclassified Bradyrhizobium]MBB4261036.1 8-oxo-dGTP pyrophosphatase MutT (NUDIX family) [Bradyrhizobium sp. CIR3A]MBB4397461.1 8-oxo-dGTP pyrophosphatase MutT (NUDIX family) [Bradyrhizobium sp. ERR14]NYG47310.1 8-oxo-dGTP pyrophosphatase MutT (NUDIX family) [Bradyrhizobium sp. IAR9]